MTKDKHEHTFTGIISINRRGAGFVAHEKFADDIYIDSRNTKTAQNGDEVEVLLLPQAPGDRRRAGKVLNVLARARSRFVGVVALDGEQTVLVPDARKMHTRIALPREASEHIRKKVLVEVTDWENLSGEIVEVIGTAGEHETEMRAITIEHGFESAFPAAVEKEAHALLSEREITERDVEEREDMREVFTCTIDPDDAKDFDDAISAREIEHGVWEIGVHIADVTHFVRSGTALDKEAQKRATSVYLVDRTIPMLPEALSNDLCSLNEGEDKRAFAAIFTFDANGNELSRRFTKTIIRSNKRFTYATAQALIDTRTASAEGSGASKNENAEYYNELANIERIAHARRKERTDTGAIEFDTKEIKFELDADGTPLRAYVKERLETMRIIEDLMLHANKAVAEFISEHAEKNPALKAFVYRIHDEPDAEKIDDLRVFLRALGHDQLETKDKQIAAKDIAKLMREIKGTPEEVVVQTATLRSMAKAIYSNKNIGHFSLAFKHYTHFTSPIRRYPDMMVHRLLYAHLTDTKISKEELERYGAMAIASSNREVEAVGAERDSVKYKQVEYMSKHVGETFSGRVSGVMASGIFVAENETQAEGMIHVSSLDGWFEHDEKHYTLVDKKNGKSYRIGDQVKIKLISADLENKQLDWQIV